MKHGSKKFMVGGLINLGAGLAQAGYGAYQENRAKRKLAQADEIAQGPIRSMAARQRIASQESDTQSAVDSALRAQATAAENITQAGGSRALVSATPGLIRATDLATQGAIDRSAGAARQARAEEMYNVGMAQEAANDNRTRLQKAADAARTATIGGIGTAVAGLAEIAGETDFSKMFKNKVPKAKALELPDPVADPASNKIRLDNMSRIRNDINTGLLDFAQGQKKQIADRILGDMQDPTGVGIPDDTIMLDEVDVKAEGGVQEPIEKTPGKFSHEQNPIDIVQEGAKIGEMTGGEYIFNPEQADEMRKLSEEGDSDLHKFIRNLLNKEQFQ